MCAMSNGTEPLNQDDLLTITLADLRRTVREYTTATTESSCNTVRQMFTDLTNSTLQLQGKLYHCMTQQQIYKPAAKASRQEVDQALQQAKQCDQQIHSYLQQQASQSSYIPNVTSQQMNQNQNFI